MTEGKLPEIFGRGEVRILRLETAAGLLALLCVLLILLVFWQRLSGVPVCYGTAAAAPGLIMPNEVPDAHVRTLAEQVALVLYNNTPQTAEANHARVGQLMHPQLLNIFEVRMEHERKLMTEHKLSTQLSIRSTQTGRSGGVYGAHIDALRVVYAGTTAIRSEELGVTLQLQAVQPSPINPWGLSVIGLEFSAPLRVEAN
jgi:hypothetical protein